MSASDWGSIRRVINHGRVAVTKILHPGDKFSDAGNEARNAISEGRANQETDNFAILPVTVRYSRVVDDLVLKYLPKTLADPIHPVAQPNVVEPVPSQVFFYRRGSFSFRKYPILVLIPISGEAAVEVVPKEPNEDAVAVNLELGHFIVVYGAFDLRVNEGEITFIVVGCKKKA